MNRTAASALILAPAHNRQQHQRSELGMVWVCLIQHEGRRPHPATNMFKLPLTSPVCSYTFHHTRMQKDSFL